MCENKIDQMGIYAEKANQALKKLKGITYT